MEIRDLKNKLLSNDNEYPHFQEWKSQIIENLLIDDDKIFNILKSENNPERFINLLVYYKLVDKNNSEKIKNLLRTGTHSDGEYIFEDNDWFKVGDKTKSPQGPTIVVHSDPETKSVTWDIKKEITEEEIYKDLSNLISKFESVQLKSFHQKPKLIQLIKSLKTIRNKFKRQI